MVKYSFFLQIYIMSEESSENPISQSSRTHETPQERKQRIEKKKIIRKQQVKERKKETMEEVEEKPLTREKKKQLQKEKNRIAAQVSRDNRKKYITDLQTKIQQLETQLEQQVCSRCKGSLLIQPSQDFFSPDDMLEEPQPIFLRRQSSADSLNSIGNYFLIIMISIAVFGLAGSVLAGEGESMTEGRILHQLALPENNLPFHEENINIYQNEHLLSEQSNGLIEVGKNLIQRQSFHSTEKQECIYDFFKSSEEQLGMDFQQFNDKSIILCKKPQVFPKIHKQSDSQASLLGRELTLFMSGPQIKQLEQDFGDQVSYYSLEGIYRMDLEIKALEKVFGSNCLI